MLHVHGSRKKYYNQAIGYNSRLDELQAAILRVKPPHIDEWNEGRRQAARRYNELLKDAPGVIIPYEAPWATHVYHQYTIRVLAGRREQLQQRLAAAGIVAMAYYPIPVPRLPVYLDRAPAIPNAQLLTGEALSLPIWPSIGPEVQEKVTSALTETLV